MRRPPGFGAAREDPQVVTNRPQACSRRWDLLDDWYDGAYPRDRCASMERRARVGHLDTPLSSTAFPSQLAQHPARIAQPVIEDSAGDVEKGTDQRVA